MNRLPVVRIAALAAALSLGATASEQQVVLKVHHFLPSTSSAQADSSFSTVRLALVRWSRA